MKDELIDLLRDRFSGHELEVPNGVWENVSGQLAASASGESLREALQDKFQAHEVDVDPGVWSNISAQLGHGAAAGSAFSAAWLAAGITAVAITAGAILWNIQETPATVVPPSVETVMQQAVAALPSAPKTAREQIATLEATPSKPAPAQVRNTAGQQTPPVTIKQVQQAPIASDAPLKDAPQPAVKPEAIIKSNGPSATRPSASQPQAPATQNTGRTSAIENTGGSEVAVSPAPDIADPNVTQPSADALPTSTQEQFHDNPFDQADPFDIFIPNVMTPNGDGINDELVISVGEHFTAMVRIFARNGSLIFQTTDLSQKWNGLLPNGNIAEEGYYNCVVQITDLGGRQHVKKEVIRLYR